MNNTCVVNLDKYNQHILHKIEAIFNSSKTILDKFSTEHKRFSQYENKGYMLRPLEYEIDTQIIKTNLDNVEVFKEEKIFIQYIPLKWSLKLLLEIPNLFDTLQNYMSELKMETDIISNFIQGKFWKNKSKSFDKEKIVCPLFVYYDEFNTGNNLGSHAGDQKLGGVHVQIPCFPPHIASKLNNIILAVLFYANDMKTAGNKVFKVLISELNTLNKDGLTINVAGKTYTIYFQLALILGDNLGLNNILGFVSNFNSGKPCRICRVTVDEMKILTTPNEDLLRTEATYTENCNL